VVHVIPCVLPFLVCGCDDTLCSWCTCRCRWRRGPPSGGGGAKRVAVWSGCCGCWGASSCTRDHAWRFLYGRQKPQRTPATEELAHRGSRFRRVLASGWVCRAAGVLPDLWPVLGAPGFCCLLPVICLGPHNFPFGVPKPAP
jgi:hypothetical protein